MFPEEEFLPRVPDPEDVIIEAPSEDQETPVVDSVVSSVDESVNNSTVLGPIPNPIVDPENSEGVATE